MCCSESGWSGVVNVSLGIGVRNSSTPLDCSSSTRVPKRVLNQRRRRVAVDHLPVHQGGRTRGGTGTAGSRF
eukprot:5386005-Alexandrium_andersonii.AAC.1